MLSRLELKEQLTDFLNRVGDGTTVHFHVRLMYLPIGGFVDDVDNLWATIAGNECNFQGYQAIEITASMFHPIVDDGDAVYTEMEVLTFAFDSGAPPGSTLTAATHAVLTRTNADLSIDLLDTVALDTTHSFTADGDFLERRYRRVAVNCAE